MTSTPVKLHVPESSFGPIVAMGDVRTVFTEQAKLHSPASPGRRVGTGAVFSLDETWPSNPLHSERSLVDDFNTRPRARQRPKKARFDIGTGHNV